MFKKNIVPLFYCIVFPILIGIILFIVPEFSPLVSVKASSLVRLARVLIAAWLIFVYINIGISFISHFESSPLAFFTIWGRYYNLRSPNHEPIGNRSFFPVYYFLPGLVVCAAASAVLLLALSTFINLSLPLLVLIAAINSLLLFLPQIALYPKAVNTVYGDEL